MSNLASSFLDIHNTIQKACQDNRRDRDDVQLIAVSKRQSVENIQEALNIGHRIFGENRIQEAYDHWETHRENYPDLKLHLIGPLQSNKVKEAIALFDVIHTVDRPKIARKLAREMADQDRSLPCFIQVNTGEEEQKSGILPKDLKEFVTLCHDELKLNIVGLMCIPPIDDIAAFHFALLKKYADELNLSQLSMGMSSDFESAIKHGAHYIRVGTALFGKRNT